MKLITELHHSFSSNAQTQRAAAQAAYMKDKFAFFGIAKPERARLEKELFKNNPMITEKELIDVLALLWQRNEREFQYSACELALRYKKLWTPDILPTFEQMIRTKSWWDTVDDIAANMLGMLIFEYPALIPQMDIWITDENMWIRRSALLFQLRWKAHTNADRLFTYCKQTMHEKEFFIRKAIGWVLREYSKTNPDAVRQFIDTHRPHLSGLSIREGSKYI